MGLKLEAQKNIHLHPEWIHSNGVPFRGRWHESFDRKAPLHLDVGMGKGRYLLAIAEQNPQVNHIGLEVKADRIMDAFSKVHTQNLTNIRFLYGDARTHLSAFEDEEVDSMSLMFPDPWPQGRKMKHRLSYPPLVEQYLRILKKGGRLLFRSDHPQMAHYSRLMFERGGFLVRDPETLDENYTNYELRYRQEGRTIWTFEALKV